MKTKTKLIFEKLKQKETYAENIDPSLIIETIEELEKKLLQIEKYLNMGGIIADKNGKPCKHGDKVKYINEYYVPVKSCDSGKPESEVKREEEIITALEWDPRICGFFIHADMHSYKGDITPDNYETVMSDDIELVEQGEKIDI